MPLFGPPNIPQLEAKRDTQGLIKALAYKDAAIRIAAAEALAPLKDLLAVEPLAGLLKDGNADVRRASIAALAARAATPAEPRSPRKPARECGPDRSSAAERRARTRPAAWQPIRHRRSGTARKARNSST